MLDLDPTTPYVFPDCEGNVQDLGYNHNSMLVAHSPEGEIPKDLEYWLISDDGHRVVIGATGLLKRTDKLDEDGALNPIVSRANALGNFVLHTTETDLYTEIDHAYQKAALLDYGSDPYRLKELFQWKAETVIARFGEFASMIPGHSILPELNDSMNVVTLAKYCPGACPFCTEPNPDRKQGMVLYNAAKIHGEMKRARRLEKKYHGNFLNQMDEGFLNASDLNWFHLAKQHIEGQPVSKWVEKNLQRISIINTRGKIVPLYDAKPSDIMDGIEIADEFHSFFPEIQKIYSFSGIRTMNACSDDYVTELHKAGVNRFLFGVESADADQLKQIQKPQTLEEITEAIDKVHRAAPGAVIKVILGAGYLGKEYNTKRNGTGVWVPTREGLERTVAFLGSKLRNTKRKQGTKDKVLVSRYIPKKGTRMATAHTQKKWIHPFSPEQMEEEVEWLVGSLMKRHINAEADYELALDGREYGSS